MYDRIKPTAISAVPVEETEQRTSALATFRP
jgi:hypothetical protein